MDNSSYDAVVVGSGPNGLAAAVRLAQERLSVLLVEANDTIGGAVRSSELTPGFIHDLCSAVHPLAAASPFFRQLGLEQYGLRWIQPELPLAHPLESGQAVTLQRSVEDTAGALGADANAYMGLIRPLVSDWDQLLPELLRPMLRWPRRPLHMARFGLHGLRSATGLAESQFKQTAARALFAGLAAHSFLRLDQAATSAIALVLGCAAHATGWPFAEGGSQQIANTLAACFTGLGGKIRTGLRVDALKDLPRARAILLDVSPRELDRIANEQLPSGYRRRLHKFRHGPGVFKIDYALSGPIPWKAAACSRAGTVHVGGTLAELAAAEAEVVRGRNPEKPFVLLAQPSLFDSKRAPEGKHIAWAYCHVPAGSNVDRTEAIERQIERFAPGFRDLVLARHTTNCAQLAERNRNCIGGDINGGAANLWQLLSRPTLSSTPYRTPRPGLYLCSASTPPGGGVHGMCGYWAAEAALNDLFR